jgi:hypothetical protein
MTIFALITLRVNCMLASYSVILRILSQVVRHENRKCSNIHGLSDSAKYFVVTPSRRAGIAHSVLRMGTGWTVRGSNAGGARIFAHVETGPGVHPASCTMGVKWPERNADQTTPSTEVTKV